MQEIQLSMHSCEQASVGDPLYHHLTQNLIGPCKDGALPLQRPFLVGGSRCLNQVEIEMVMMACATNHPQKRCLILPSETAFSHNKRGIRVTSPKLPRNRGFFSEVFPPLSRKTQNATISLQHLFPDFPLQAARAASMTPVKANLNPDTPVLPEPEGASSDAFSFPLVGGWGVSQLPCTRIRGLHIPSSRLG